MTVVQVVERRFSAASGAIQDWSWALARRHNGLSGRNFTDEDA